MYTAIVNPNICFFFEVFKRTKGLKEQPTSTNKIPSRAKAENLDPVQHRPET